MSGNDRFTAPASDVAARVAAQTLAKREAEYANEVRRLLDSAREVMHRHGTTKRVRVADIVAGAGLSNDAFYRHFPSKDSLIAALLQDGSQRLARSISRQMAGESTPEGRIGRWVVALMAQTEERTAANTLTILWNGSGVGMSFAAGRHDPTLELAPLLEEPFAELGCPSPELVASVVAHGTLGRMSQFLWAGERPTPGEVDAITQLCIRAATPRPDGAAPD